MSVLDEIGRVAAKMRTMVGRALIKAVDDSNLIQTLTIRILDDDSDEPDEVEHFQPYGFAARPAVGGEALVVAVGGDRGHLVAVATDGSSERPGLEEGEVAMYTGEDGGDGSADRHMLKMAAGRKVFAECAEFIAGANDTDPAAIQAMVLDGKLKAYIDAQIVAKLSAHTHSFAASVTGGGGGTVAGTTGASPVVDPAGDIASSKAKAAL